MPTGQHLVYVSSKELLNALPANAALLSPTGDIKAVNSSWIKFADENGLHMSNYGLGSNYLRICEAAQGADREISLDVARGIREVASGTRTTLSVQYPCHSPDQRRWFLLNATRLGNQLPSSVLTLHEDVTPLVLGQERLADINAELAHVIAFISHDVRVPLGTIQNYLELIRQGVGDMIERSTVEYLNIISATTSKLNNLVTDTLKLALLKSEQRMSMQQLDMNLVVGEAIKNASCLIRAHNATVDVDPLGFAYGHFSYLVSLFQNLISNAVLYSESKARVHVGVAWRDTEKLYFVQDFGPGIPPELQDTIFQPFSRPNLAETKGSGLGLAICRYIVEHHGGRIFVESQPGQGSTFFFSLQPNTSEPAPSH